MKNNYFKIMTLITLIAAGHADAMQNAETMLQLQTADNEITRISKAVAIQHFGTIKNMLIDAPEDNIIRLQPIALKATLEHLIADLRKQPINAPIVDNEIAIIPKLQDLIAKLKAAEFLQTSEEIFEQYTRKIANLLISNEALDSFLQDNAEFTGLMNNISNPNFRDRIYKKYISPPCTNIRHNTRIKSAVFSPDGTKILTASEDKTAKILSLDANNQRPDHTIQHNALIESVVFSPDGTKILTASEDKTAKIVWLNANNRWQEYTIRHNKSIRTACFYFSPDGIKVFTMSDDHTAKIVWLDENNKWQEYTIWHDSWIQSAVFSPDGTKILTIPNDHTAKIVWLDENNKWQEYTIRHNAEIRSATFSPDGTKVVTASYDHTAKIVWRDANNQWHRTCDSASNRVNSAVFSPDGTKVVTASDDETAKIVWRDENNEWQEHVIRHKLPDSFSRYFHPMAPK